MRAVLDTNVLVSALMSLGGTCDHILRLAGQEYEICLDWRILREYEKVLGRPELRIHPTDVERTMEFMRAQCEVLRGEPRRIVLPDPEDVPFLEVALEAKAVLVTGNLRHFPPRARSGVTVMTPAEFLDFLRRSSR